MTNFECVSNCDGVDTSSLNPILNYIGLSNGPSGINIRVVTSDGDMDLASVGVSEQTTFELDVEINPDNGTFDPQTLVAIGSQGEFLSRSAGDPATATIRVQPTAGAINRSVQATEPSEWPDRDVTASFDADAVLIINVVDIGGEEFSEMEDVSITTNAQMFAMPQYEPPTADKAPRIVVDIAAPHFRTDGTTVNTGLFKAFLPDKLLDTWGVSDPSRLTATAPTGSGTFSVTEVSNGVRVELTNYHYSSGSAVISVNDSTTSGGPAAAFTYNPQQPATDASVSFDASGSSVSDGTIQSYEWDFDGDGSTDATGETTTHAFASPGNHEVTLRVTDDSGATDSVTKSVTVTAPAPSHQTTVDVVLQGAPNGLRKYSVNVSGPANATISAVNRQLEFGTFQIESGGEGQAFVTAREVSFSGGADAFTGDKTLVTIEFAGNVSEDAVAVEVLSLSDKDGGQMDQNRVTLEVSQSRANPFGGPIPGTGADNAPTDPDGDGLFDDVNGDGKSNFDDAIALAFAGAGDFSDAQVEALDFDGDGDVDFEDAIELAFSN